MTLENKTMVVTLACISLSFCLFHTTIYTQSDSDDTAHTTTQQSDESAYSKKTTQDNFPTETTTDQPLPTTPQEKIFPKTINPEMRLSIHDAQRVVQEIEVLGNKVVSQAAILHTIPIKIGDVFNVNYTATMIKNLYKLGYFHQIKIFAEPIDEDKVKLYVVVEEKPKLSNVTFVGNKAITEKELKEQLHIESITTLAHAELKAIITKIKKQYHKKNYHGVQVEAKINPDTDNTVSAEFTIKEGKKSYLNRISFKGNKNIPSKKLKRILFSQEDWLFSFMNRGGVYNSEMTEGDKYMIEDIYRNNGFINAKVTNVEVEQDPVTNNHHITYSIYEGDRYRIKDVEIEGNDKVPTERLRMVIPLYPGQIYSSENLRIALDNLRILWGEFGYIFADIEPNVSTDETDKTVSIQFNTDVKDQIYLNRITIRGNKKTRDKVIRRQLFLEEGEMITNQKMEISKACVGLLGYFDPKNGVTWKTTRINDTQADLDLVLNEVKTGSFSTNISWGGTPTRAQTPQTGINANISFGDKNFLGTGVALAASADISQRYQAIQASISNPWMFDRPIRGSLAGYIKASEYNDQINFAEEAPFEQVIGGAAGVGYVAKLLGGVMIDGRVTVENIYYTDKLQAAKRFNAGDRFIADVILKRYFQDGNQISLVGSFSQDKRNGVVFPTNGYQWNWFGQWSFPGWCLLPKSQATDCCAVRTHPKTTFNYVKTEFDASWYTPLIGEHDLVLCVHGNMGIVHKLRGNDIPWKNLYHVGGPTTVRGYLYGQIGPTWKNDSLGAAKAFFVNVEFIVPISANLNTRAVVFYDGGAGWDTPYKADFSAAARAVGLSFEKEFTNNNFFYRHTVGVGVRLKSPSPLQVDFGIKLNPSRLFRKNLTELHFSMENSF